MRESTMEYEVARSRQSDADNETQDLLHRLELHDDTYHDMARISRELKRVRQERRKAKDTVAELEPVCKWREENARALKSLEQLLGAVRKAEKATQNRIYMDRTDAVRKAVKTEIHTRPGQSAKRLLQPPEVITDLLDDFFPVNKVFGTIALHQDLSLKLRQTAAFVYMVSYEDQSRSHG